MQVLYILAMSLIVATVLWLLLPWVTKKIEEPFQSSGIVIESCGATPPNAVDTQVTSQQDAETYQKYIETGRKEHNRLADIMTLEQRNQLGSVKKNEIKDGKSVIADFNTLLKRALTNAEVDPAIPDGPYEETRTVEYKDVNIPVTITGQPQNVRVKQGSLTGDPPALDKPYSFFGISNSYVEESVNLDTSMLGDAKRCEAINTINKKNSGFGTLEALCGVLDPNTATANDAQACGVCLKGGEPINKLSDIGMGGILLAVKDFFGAMYLSPTDRTARKTQPTLGSCDAGFFFTDKDACVKKARQMQCSAYGDAGGFNVASAKGLNNENGENLSCVACPKGTKGNNTYVYNNATDGGVQFRFLAPTGTGNTRVAIYQGTLVDKNRKGQITLSADTQTISLSNVKPGDIYVIEVVQDFPHRPRGQPEVFFVMKRKTAEGTSVGFDDAADASAFSTSIGVTMATEAQLRTHVNSQYPSPQVCEPGWVSTGSTTRALYTVHRADNLDMTKCAYNPNSAGMTVYTPPASSTVKYGCWVYGIKPNQTYLSNTTDVRNMFTYITTTNDANVDEVSRGSIASLYTDTNPNYRGILVQMEPANSAAELVSRRRDPVERFITKVGSNDIPVDSTSEKKLQYYSRNGLFDSSQKIVAPKPAAATAFIPSQYWLWSNDHKQTTFTFTVEIPGYFADPTFGDDLTMCPTGVLLANKNSLNRAVVSACEQGLADKEGVPNKSCLAELFISVGGKDTGDLHPNKTPISVGDTNARMILYSDYVLPSGTYNTNPLTMLTKRTQQEVRDYLQTFVDHAKGINLPRRNTGESVDDYNKRRKDVMNRAITNMYGTQADLLTACSRLIEDSNTGTVTIGTVTEPDAYCLDELYKDVKTYINSGTTDYYSGIRPDEIASFDVKQANPYRTCQPGGTWAPIAEDGTVNQTAVDAIKAAIGDTYSYTKAKDALKGIFDSAIAGDSDALLKCYGIRKKEYLTNCEGLQVYAIRILPSAYRYGLTGTTPSAIRIPTGGLKAYSASSSTPLTVGNTTKIYNKSAEGDYVDAADTGTYDVKQSKVTYTFGSDANVQRVTYNNSMFAPEKADGMVVQLLDNSTPTKVVAQKVLTDGTAGLKTLFFNADDVRPFVYFSEVKQGLEFRLESAVYPDLYLTAASSSNPTAAKLEILTESSNSDTYRRSIFVLNDDKINNVATNVFSILCRTTGTYLKTDTATYLGQFATIDTTADTATLSWSAWAIRPAINGAPGYISIESAGYPGVYLVPNGVTTTTNGVTTTAWGVKAEPLSMTSDFDKFRSCWRLQPTD